MQNEFSRKIEIYVVCIRKKKKKNQVPNGTVKYVFFFPIYALLNLA